MDAFGRHSSPSRWSFSSAASAGAAGVVRGLALLVSGLIVYPAGCVKSWLRHRKTKVITWTREQSQDLSRLSRRR